MVEFLTNIVQFLSLNDIIKFFTNYKAVGKLTLNYRNTDEDGYLMLVKSNITNENFSRHADEKDGHIVTDDFQLVNDLLDSDILGIIMSKAN